VPKDEAPAPDKDKNEQEDTQRISGRAVDEFTCRRYIFKSSLKVQRMQNFLVIMNIFSSNLPRQL